MKKFLFLLSGFFMCYHLYSQDIIYKTDGTEIKAVVTEITSDIVKYKIFTQQDGPVRNIFIRDVFMIIYKDGTKEVFKGKYDEKQQSATDINPEVVNSNNEYNRSNQTPAINEPAKQAARAEPQEIKPKKAVEEKKAALFLKGGFSPIMGFAGGEYFNRKIAIQAGWASLTAPISGETRSTIGLGFSAYLFDWYKSSPYISYGFSTNGAVYENGMTIYGSLNNYWVSLNTVFVGYRVIIARLIDLRVGTGYRWSEYTRGFAYEGVIGLKLFSHDVRK
jgi:hypothetical protein